MRRIPSLSLALVVGLLGSTALRAEGDAKSLLDFEGKMLGKVAARLDLPAETKAQMKAVLSRYAPQRTTLLEQLADDLGALKEVQAEEGASDAERTQLLERLDADRKALRSLRVTKREELGSFLSDSQKVRFLAKAARRHADRKPGRLSKLRGFLRKHVPTFLEKVVGVDPAAIEAMTATRDEREPAREQLKAEWKALAAELKAFADGGSQDEEAARLLVAKARGLREKVHASIDEGLAAFRARLTTAQRADLVAKVYGAFQRVAGFVGHFVEIEELKLFL